MDLATPIAEHLLEHRDDLGRDLDGIYQAVQTEFPGATWTDIAAAAEILAVREGRLGLDLGQLPEATACAAVRRREQHAGDAR